MKQNFISSRHRLSFIAMGMCAIAVVGNGLDADPAQLPLPTKIGETFMVDNFDFKITTTDMGFNFNSGNMGAINSPALITDIKWSPLSCGTEGGSLSLPFNFANYENAFCGVFLSLFNLTDTKIRQEGDGVEPPTSTQFPLHYLDFDNLYGAFQPLTNRSVERIAFDARLVTGTTPVNIKVELQDGNGARRYAYVTLSSSNWTSFSLTRSEFANVSGAFLWSKVRTFSLVIERAGHVNNPISGTLLVDNIRLVDTDGIYPDLAAAKDPATGKLQPQYRDAFLDHVRKLSFLYFLDFASTDPRTGGLIQDRGTFPSLMTIGGGGFQLTAYALGAERGYITRADAANRVNNLLDALYEAPQDTNRVGTAGYKGFYYHFLGIDGLRKQNFDFNATVATDESENTVELSTIDTALLLAGVVTAKQYFTENNPAENAIRSAADAIVRRVEWPFMFTSNTDGNRQQLALGWKPLENQNAPFQVNDGFGTGHFSSKNDGSPFTDTLDYYTDEALLAALLAMAAPESGNRLGRAVWDDIIRNGDGFLMNYSGALFTYQFLSCWVDTWVMGRDNHPERPVDFFENTHAATFAMREHAITNGNRFAGVGTNAWAYTACEGPYDGYEAETIPSMKLGIVGNTLIPIGGVNLEGEAATGDGDVMMRDAASGGLTRRYVVSAGEAMQWSFTVATSAVYSVMLRYSNDGPADTLAIFVDGVEFDRVTTTSTGSGGLGWNIFNEVTFTNTLTLTAGLHTARVEVVSCDRYGVEIDAICMGALVCDSGTLAPYGAGSAIVHAPEETTDSLWHYANLDLNGDGQPDLLHPRFGFADAFNLDIIGHPLPASTTDVFRTSGPWANMTGFAIDQGPMFILLDNYLGGQLAPRLFMSDPDIRRALGEIFDAPPDIYEWQTSATSGTLRWKSGKPATVETCTDLADPQWLSLPGVHSNNLLDVQLGPSPRRFFKVKHIE